MMGYLLDHIHEIIGSSSVIIAGTYWMYKRVSSKKKSQATKLITSTSDNYTLNKYIADLLRRSSSLTFGDPTIKNDSEFTQQSGLITLDQLWTPLRVADSQVRSGKQGTHDNMAEKNEGEDLLRLYNSTEDSMLILGDPGSGKSTSLSFFTLIGIKEFNKNNSNKLPIWISLSNLSTTETNDIETILSGVSELELALKRDGPDVEQQLKNILREYILKGKALILLDGLDEVKDYNLAEIRKSIAQVVSLKNQNRVIVTCRIFDYKQANPSRKLPIKHELELLGYNSSQQKEYVTKWYEAAVRSGKFTQRQADDLREALIVELKSERLSEIGSSPLLLTLLTLIHSEEAKLPDTRAVLCDKAISFMLADSAKWRIREAGSSTIATPPVFSLAIEVGYFIHNKEETNKKSGPLVSKSDILSLAEKICKEISDADTGRDSPSELELADRFLNSHGLMVNVSTDMYRFSHRSFQEYLAGQYFVVGAKIEQVLEKSSSNHWIEPYKLMASFAGHDGSNLFLVLEIIKTLEKNKETVSSIQLAGEMLVEIGKRRLALHQFSYVFKNTESLWDRIIHYTLGQINDFSLNLATRQRSARLLSDLGDKRFENYFPELIDISQKKSIIGSKKLDISKIQDSGGYVGRPRQIELVNYKIGKYLVTNADFKRFVDDDGYTNLDYWEGKLSKGWVLGEIQVLDDIKHHWLSTVEYHHAKEIRDGEIETKDLMQEVIIRTQPRQHPFYWNDRRFNQYNQPVVGINYWEAEAYCNWLTNKARKDGLIQSTQKFCIPTEFEWEVASRPISDDRIYSWGDEWDEEKAHVSTNILNMRQPVAVGVYPPSYKNGPFDLVGNVWEWTKSLFLPYEIENDSYRINIDSLNERVVRGSSWYNTSTVAACSARAVDRSYNLFYDVGFRVVCIDNDSLRL
jgi:formylglycine-generating enzyme required for sulfatase activity